MPTAQHYIVCLSCREQHTVDRAVALAAGDPDPLDPDVGLFTDQEAAAQHSVDTGHVLTSQPVTRWE